MDTMCCIFQTRYFGISFRKLEYDQTSSTREHCICAKLKGPSYARTLESASRRPRKRGPLRLPQMLPVRQGRFTLATTFLVSTFLPWEHFGY